MLQTRRQAVRLLQLPFVHRRRGYADVTPSEPNSGNEHPHTHNSSAKTSDHAISAGHHEVTRRNVHPTPDHEPIGKGIFVVLAVVFGSLAVYKYSRTDSADTISAGDVAKQPWLTRMLHRFDYYGEQNAIRNAIFTDMVQKAGHDRNFFDGAPGKGYIELKSAEVYFNTGSPWNVPAGSQANLDHLREYYRKKDIELEEERKERAEWMARHCNGKTETERFKESVGKTINTILNLGSKASKGQ